jgi:tRNA(Ile)-lysidine synthase
MLLETVHNTIMRHRMLQPGDLVVVAVSGGPDSVALCHLLHRLRHRHKVELLVAHVHHGLRGTEADQDALFVRNFSSTLELPAVEQRLDVHSWQQEHGGSLQMAARALRYQYLHQVMAEKGANKLALGHNADDQAEEVLLRILRGAGQRGLSGMAPCNRTGVIRPLLECHRQEIVVYLRDHDLAFRQDSSNLKPWCQRNLLRLEVLPQLQQAFNSNLNATLLRTSKILREEENFWESHLASWLREHSLNHGDDGIRFLIKPFLETHPAMQKRLLRRVVQEVKGDLRGFGFHHTEILLQLCRSPAASRRIDLPGEVRAEKSYEWMTVTLRPDTVEDFHFRISEHGFHPFPLLNHTMVVELLDSDMNVEFSHDPNEAIMDPDKVTFPLTLRSSKPGDRFRPLGLGGSKKLKDFFIDAKVPKSRRRQTPILCTEDHIIWVVGHRLDDRVKLTSHTSRLLRLRYLKGLVEEL